MDHAGLPLKTVLEQLDLLGEEVIPVLRKEFAALKPAHVPDAPTHASLVASRHSVRPALPITAERDVTADSAPAADAADNVVPARVLGEPTTVGS